ncbi:MAG: hypothetical protein GY913_32360 [Proteobacteria bacterium]|nr:hypothetical protein [Pseudomonadota bacterium]MCP4921615.1 hypothetical protein [Pseudomonadota bacterium]
MTLLLSLACVRYDHEPDHHETEPVPDCALWFGYTLDDTALEGEWESDGRTGWLEAELTWQEEDGFYLDGQVAEWGGEPGSLFGWVHEGDEGRVVEGYGGFEDEAVAMYGLETSFGEGEGWFAVASHHLAETWTDGVVSSEDGHYGTYTESSVHLTIPDAGGDITVDATRETFEDGDTRFWGEAMRGAESFGWVWGEGSGVDGGVDATAWMYPYGC